MAEKIDLRSDTVTQPTFAMREAMFHAAVGDDVFGDDPTVQALQEYTAELLGKEAGLFCCSGTQSNFVALLGHCERGDEYIVGQHAHTYRFEGGGAAVFGSIQPQPIDFEEDGSLPLYKIEAMIKPDDPHFARTRLVCLENTHLGKVVPLDYIEAASQFVHEKGLAFHLDGARLFNASVATGRPAIDIAKHFDSISVCLSKGLGAPVGSVLCGSKALIERARRWRQVAGGGMRQAGIIAAGGFYALQHHVERLAEDHEKAAQLKAAFERIDEIRLHPGTGQTNILFFDAERIDALRSWLEGQGILVSGRDSMRMVTHLDVSFEDIQAVIQAVQRFYTSRKMS